MNDKTAAHWSFWVVGAIALIWNVLGSANFFMQMDPEMLEAYRDSERAIIEGRPLWATAAFGLGVLGGVIGSLLLLARQSTAFYVFVLSLVGVVITMIHTLTAGIDFGVGEVVGIIFMPVAVAGFLIWYAKLAQQRGWL